MSNNLNFFNLKEKHQFHLVDSSLLPVVTGFSAMLVVMSLVFYWHPSSISAIAKFDGLLMQIAIFIFMTVLFSWFITVVRESGEGNHTKVVRKGLRYGMALFIISEVMFFFAFFWGFFHFSLSPSIAIGCVWPPKSIQPLDIWGLPLVNTLLLLTSGLTITLAHHSILKASNRTEHFKFTKHLFVTILLGITFLICQGIEYKYGVTFTWKENVYGSAFFVTTGFHGFHVTVGTIFLLFCFVREWITGIAAVYEYPLFNQLHLSRFAFTKEQHFGFEAAAWYWHFVDVVWLFLFITVYWWGS
jgi:heme/copper-type cytochrome/quinol oxidase subunit 3